MGIPDRIRNKVAKLLDCSTDNIAHATSVTDTINLLANGFPFQDEDIVVTFKGDYPSNVLPWMLPAKKWGLKHVMLENPLPDADWLRENLPIKTKLLDISHVAFDTGRKVDLVSIGKLCAERDIIFVVDATQSFGGMPITKEELSYIDVLACSCYKWLLGPYGSSFAYYSDRMIELIGSKSGNWITSPNSKHVWNLLDYTTESLPGARKFDRGQTPNMLINAALEGSLEVLSKIGLDYIQENNQKLRNFFMDNLPYNKFSLVTPKDRSMVGNIVSIQAKSGDSLQLEAELKHYNIDVSVREGKLRLSFHLFNTQKQLETLIKVLDKH